MSSDAYLNRSGLAYLWAKMKAAFAPHDRGVEFIRGTWTAASGTWTGVSEDTELYDGKKIILFMPFAGSGNATLNLTLADGSATGPKNVYYNGTTRFTTQLGQYAQIELIYHDSLVIGSTAYTGWWYTSDRDTQTGAYQVNLNYGRYVAHTALYRYQFLLTYNEEELLPINAVNNNTGTAKVLTTEDFDPFGPIYYYASTTNKAADANINNAYCYFKTHSADMRYSFNTGSTLTPYRAVYLVAKMQPNGRAKLHTSPISQSLPSSEDGLIYIYLGQAYTSTNIEFSLHHPVYHYKNGRVQIYTPDADFNPFSTDSNGRLCYTYDVSDPGYESFDVDTNGRLTYTYE